MIQQVGDACFDQDTTIGPIGVYDWDGNGDSVTNIAAGKTLTIDAVKIEPSLLFDGFDGTHEPRAADAAERERKHQDRARAGKRLNHQRSRWHEAELFGELPKQERAREQAGHHQQAHARAVRRDTTLEQSTCFLSHRHHGWIVVARCVGVVFTRAAAADPWRRRAR